MEAIITKHAKKRAKSRLGWNNAALNNIASKALLQGIKQGEYSGRFQKWMSKIYLKNKVANNLRVYGQVLFVFRNQTLITLYQIPNNFKISLKKWQTK